MSGSNRVGCHGARRWLHKGHDSWASRAPCLILLALTLDACHEVLATPQTFTEIFTCTVLFFRTCTVLVLFSFFCRALCSSQAASADGLLSGQVHHPEALHQHHLITWEQYLATPTPTDESLPANTPSCPGININQSYLLVLGFRKKGPFFRRVNCIMIDWWILVVCEIHL